MQKTRCMLCCVLLGSLTISSSSAQRHAAHSCMLHTHAALACPAQGEHSARQCELRRHAERFAVWQLPGGELMIFISFGNFLVVSWWPLRTVLRACAWSCLGCARYHVLCSGHSAAGPVYSLPLSLAT